MTYTAAVNLCDFDPDRAYVCLTHNHQWIEDDSDRCEYKRMLDAEAAIQRVRDMCASNRWLIDVDILAVLDGEA